MRIEKTAFEGLLILHPTIIADDRGYFFESFSEGKFRVETGKNMSFVQDNESMSNKGVLRGLHFQVPPKSQAKLIRVTKGAVLDVVVDLRVTQPTFGQHFKMILDDKEKKQLFIPEGFAHGFCVLEDETIFSYKCTNYYSKDHDRSLLWCDPTLNIDWEINHPIVSEKDMNGQKFEHFQDVFF